MDSQPSTSSVPSKNFLSDFQSQHQSQLKDSQSSSFVPQIPVRNTFEQEIDMEYRLELEKASLSDPESGRVVSRLQDGKLGVRVDFNVATEFLLIGGVEYFLHPETRSFLPTDDEAFCKHFLNWRAKLEELRVAAAERARRAEEDRLLAEFRSRQSQPQHVAPPVSMFSSSFRVPSNATAPPSYAASAYGSSSSSSYSSSARVANPTRVCRTPGCTRLPGSDHKGGYYWVCWDCNANLPPK